MDYEVRGSNYVICKDSVYFALSVAQVSELRDMLNDIIDKEYRLKNIDCNARRPGRPHGPERKIVTTSLLSDDAAWLSAQVRSNRSLFDEALALLREKHAGIKKAP